MISLGAIKASHAAASVDIRKKVRLVAEILFEDDMVSARLATAVSESLRSLPGESVISLWISDDRDMSFGMFFELKEEVEIPGFLASFFDLVTGERSKQGGFTITMVKHIVGRSMPSDKELKLLRSIATRRSRDDLFADVKAKNEELERHRAKLEETVRRRTAQAEGAMMRAEAASKAKDEFLASMSHELRTPLNAVLSLSESLLEGIYGEINEKQQKAIGMMETSGRHLLSLINDVLDLSKVEAGMMELSVGAVDVAQLVESSLLFVRERAMKKGLKLTSVVDPQLATLQADGRRLKQVLVNVLTNAVKFTDEGEVGLDVTGDREAKQVRFVVRDTGIGISEEGLEQLWRPFSQLDSGLDRQYEGTGLGLSLVKEMTELHGGSVGVTSAGLGKGSQFTVTLPWEPDAATDRVRPSQPRTGLTDKVSMYVRRALVVEDSPNVSDQLRRYLEEMDAEVLVLPRGTGAATQAEAFRPDVVLLDIYLPSESGWDVLEELKTNPRTQEIPVVIVSGADERARGLQAGAAEYLIKPVSRAELYAALLLAVGPTDDSEARSGAEPLVLLAEDNETNIVSITDYLEAKGFRVRVARDGVEALEALAAERPDLVLMDIQMPRMDGLEAMRKIREDGALKDLPIIALTALAMSGDEDRIREAGADEYVSKPVNMKQLVATIDRLLGP